MSSRSQPARVVNIALLGLAAGIAVSGMLAWLVNEINTPPRVMAQYIERRTSGHNPFIVSAGRQASGLLRWLDRTDYDHVLMPVPTGNAPGNPARVPEFGTTQGRKLVPVRSVEEALEAFGRAKPGDAITFAPGTYRFTGTAIALSGAGTRDAAISVRANQAGTVTLEFDMIEGFRVTQPHWLFENLRIRGVCARHDDCEHAFHVVGRASHFIARDNEVIDFNAHFKINGNESAFPDDGLIEGNVLRNDSIRNTGNPVTPIDLVAASGWVARRNLISDFLKGGGDQISYGAFAKGGGGGNVFDRNVVFCERQFKGAPGQRIGLSLGGGGSEKSFCRDRRCITEQEGGAITGNLVMSCSDDGIYINRSSSSRVDHNTLVDTSGVSVRFPESSADLEGNLVDGSIRARDEAAVHTTDNVQTSLVRQFVGSHPVRRMFRDLGSLHWESPPPRRTVNAKSSIDLCGASRPPNPTYGAFEDITVCALRK